MLPADVLKQAQQELCDWNGLGTSVMEISHRGKEFIQVAEEAEKDFRDLLNIPSNYKVLFCHGGGRGQFAGVPLNILGDKTTADYVDAGYWAASAVKEAHKYCTPNVIDAKVTVDGLRAVKPMSEWQLSDNAAYLHYCPNETIDGIAIDETPNFGKDVVVAADFSSTILSAPIDVSRYGVIYAGAQKNIGPAGLTIVIVREDLLGKAHTSCPSILDYTVLNDNDSMFNALKALGVHYTLSDDRTRCEVTGNGGALQTGEELELFLGNAGTAMRPLAAALCLGRNNIVLTGEPRMKERPIGHLVDALRQGGAQIEYLEQENYPPLRLRGGFTGGHVEVDGSVSSQFLTALLMTAPLAPQDTVITIKGELVSKPYIDITLHLMKTFGVEVENQSYQRFVVRGVQQYQSPGSYLVEGDASSASYFLAAGAIKGGTVKVTGIGRNSVQGDIRFADVLEKMGAVVTWGDDFISCTHGELKAIDMDMNHIPDAAMTIATAALFAKGTTTLRNIYNWRVKETDRLFAMATELRKVGAEVEEGEDYIRVTPPAKLQVAEIGTYNDHRMAMCFSLVALSDTPVTILDPKCTAKTFPDYFEQLARISTLA